VFLRAGKWCVSCAQVPGCVTPRRDLSGLTCAVSHGAADTARVSPRPVCEGTAFTGGGRCRCPARVSGTREDLSKGVEVNVGVDRSVLRVQAAVHETDERFGWQL
jgi:hypothetical protein